MELHHFFTKQRVLIVAGKGGVGKSAVSAGLALASARSGLRTLLVNLNSESIDIPVHEHLECVTVTPGRALTDFLSSKGLGLLSRQLARSGIVELVATTAPGLDDLLVLGRLKAYERENRADVIIVDGPAAGHAIDFVRAPAQLRKAIPSGPIGQQAEEVITMLADASRCAVLMVTTPAMTPVLETIEVCNELTNTQHISINNIVVNKTDAEIHPVQIGNIDASLRDGVSYALARQQAQHVATQTLRDSVSVPLIHIRRHNIEGAQLVEKLADDFTLQVGEMS